MARKISRICGTVVAIGLACGSAQHALADLAVQFTGANPANNTLSSSVGFSFTPNTNVSVDALDFINPVGTGGAVRIYDGSATTLVSATVLSTDPTESVDGYTYNVHAITPFTLNAATTYYIVADVPSLQDIYAIQATGLVTEPRIAFGAGVIQKGSFGNPLTDANAGAYNPSYFAPNFDLVPEPTSLAVLGAVTAFGLMRRRRRAC